jgi:hypothetical protein
VLFLTWGLAVAVVGLYVWFVVWRLRVDKRKKAATVDDAERMSATIARLAAAEPAARPEPAVRSESSAPADSQLEPVATPAPSTAAVAAPPPEKVTTVAAALSGISLPHDLTPLTMVADRPGVGDRVVFSTRSAPPEAVGSALSDELERLGYTVRPLDEQTIAASRGEQRLILVIHPEGAHAKIGDQKAFPAVPDLSVVVEVWIP